MIREKDHWLGEEKKIFKGGKNILHGTVVADTQCCEFVKTDRNLQNRVNLNVGKFLKLLVG